MTKLPVIHVKMLGQMCYRKALNIQKAAVNDILQCLRADRLQFIKGNLFFVEHNPVYTIGVRNKQYINEEVKFKQLKADFVKTDRGGLITFHGPGQLVVYPIIYLGNFRSKSIKWYVKELENVILDTCTYFGLKAYTNENVGVWINDRKIASIGIHASRYVTSHGISINCNTDLTWFTHIEACGIPGKEATSFSKELNRDVSVEEIIPIFLNTFQKRFPCEFVCDT